MRQGLLICLGVALGTLIGLSAYTFVYAKGGSYLLDNPEACANCHVMNEQFSGWVKSSHRAVATCNDCHTPPGLISKYAVKAINGFNHSWAFTTGRFPDEIRINNMNRRVTEQACRKCHEAITLAIEGTHDQQAECIACHPTVGHP